MQLDNLRDKTILITGITGLIGQHILKTLHPHLESHNIHIIGYSKHSPTNILKYASSHAQFITRDLSKDPESYFAWHDPVDYIVHAATYGQPAKFTRLPLETITLNTTLLTSLLNCLFPWGRLLFLSSSEVYSGLDKDEYCETDIGNTTPQHPRGAYIEAKRVGEAICAAVPNTVVARVSMVYGPGTRKSDERVLYQLIDQAIRTRRIDLRDDGSAIRTYCHVDNAVEMLLNILLNGKDTLYNVGGISNISIYELAKLIGDMFNVHVFRGASIVYDAPKSVKLNINKYINEFGTPDFVTLKIGIEEIINNAI